MERRRSFFRGSELPRLLVLAALMVGGWAAFWMFARARGVPEAPRPLAAADRPPPRVVPDRSIEFEAVRDKTPMSFRDNAAYALLLSRARGKRAREIAAEARRDVLLTHLWERPDLYRGVPVHVRGTALRVLRYESALSSSGWLYEAWVVTPEARRVPYVCVFEDVPRGFPIGANVSERVAFNGYFLKILKYEAGDMARGAPVLVGRVGWAPREGAAPAPRSMGPLLRWTLVGLGAMFLVTAVRWALGMGRLFGRAPWGRSSRRDGDDVGADGGPRPRASDEIAPSALAEWARSMADEGDDDDDDGEDAEEFPRGREGAGR